MKTKLNNSKTGGRTERSDGSLQRMVRPLRASKCPACGHELSKKYRRSLTPLEWQKLETAYWMEAWHRELEANRSKMPNKH